MSLHTHKHTKPHSRITLVKVGISFPFKFCIHIYAEGNTMGIEPLAQCWKPFAVLWIQQTGFRWWHCLYLWGEWPLMAKGVAKENETEILDIRLIKLWQMPHVVGCYEGIVEDYILLPLSKRFGRWFLLKCTFHVTLMNRWGFRQPCKTCGGVVRNIGSLFTQTFCNYTEWLPLTTIYGTPKKTSNPTFPINKDCLVLSALR